MAKMTRNGALAGMFYCAVTVLVWGEYKWLNLYELVPGFAFASIAIVIVVRLCTGIGKMQAGFAKMREQIQ